VRGEKEPALKDTGATVPVEGEVDVVDDVAELERVLLLMAPVL
jgi:hypothetical protein